MLPAVVAVMAHIDRRSSRIRDRHGANPSRRQNQSPIEPDPTEMWDDGEPTEGVVNTTVSLVDLSSDGVVREQVSRPQDGRASRPAGRKRHSRGLRKADDPFRGIQQVMAQSFGVRL
jgi:hypothetical protein